MQPAIWISEITFNDGTTINFQQDEIIVVVGPNNSGKSAMLKEAHVCLRSTNNPRKIISSIKFESFGTKQAVIELLKRYSKIHMSNDNPIPHLIGLGYSVYSAQLENQWDNSKNGFGDVADFFTTSISTEKRLLAANPAQNINFLKDAAKHPISRLQRWRQLEQRFNTYFQRVFSKDLIVHRNYGSTVPLFVGKTPEGFEYHTEEYQVELEKQDLLHEQGDGMRSFVGILLTAAIEYISILFIDEPEAFLHPPQARQLANLLINEIPGRKQFWFATHSIDFLLGLLEAPGKKLKIVRIERENNINKISSISQTEIDLVWKDPLLRYSNILSGLFHDQVIICEGDSDCRFYSAIFSTLDTTEPKPDTLFVHCGGKHRIPVVIKALSKLKVPVKVVADFDVLNNEFPLRTIIEDAGGEWNDFLKDWRTIKAAIDAKRPELQLKELKEKIDAIFATVETQIMPSQKLKEIKSELNKASAWAHAKESGKSFIPSGMATQAFERLSSNLKNLGIFILENGQLESFDKSIGDHGPGWVNQVLMKDLVADRALNDARDFVKEVMLR